MTETPASGNRWEPTTAPPAAPPAQAASTDPTPRARVDRGDLRTALVSGAVAALVVLVACAAFALGRATAGGDDGAPDDGRFGPGDQRGGFGLPQGSES